MLVFDCSVAAVAASAAFVAAALIAKAAEAMLRLVLSWLLSWVMVNRPGGSVSWCSEDLPWSDHQVPYINFIDRPAQQVAR